MQPIEIRFNRYSYLIPIPFVLFLMWIFYWFTIAEPNENLTGSANIILAVTIFVEVVGLFLTIYFFRQFLQPPVIFRMDEDGFVYQPAGVSTGLIRWEDISDVNEVNVSKVVRNSQLNEPALAIQLNNPEAFRKQYNFLLAKAMQLGHKMYQADILIEKGYLKKHYEAVKAEMKQRVPLSFRQFGINPVSKVEI